MARYSPTDWETFNRIQITVGQPETVVFFAARKARTRRLIEYGAILESIFPATTAMTGEEVKAFLSAISRLPEVVRLLKNESDSQDLQQL